MRAFSVIILLAALVLPSGCASVSPPSDISAADLQTLHTQAAQVDATAQVKLGILYTNGEGLTQDYTKARAWFEKAAAQGNADAQNRLGVLHENGQGVPQDYAKAREWYEKAAAQGNKEAQFNLGRLYAQGRGVPLDYAMGRQWYEKAAAQGDAAAQLNLGGLYAKGQGVPEDYVRAYMWFNLAAAHSTGDDLKFAVDDRDNVARRMTPAQIVEAKQLSEQCQAQQLKGC